MVLDKAYIYEAGVAMAGVLGYPEHNQNLYIASNTLADLMKTIVGIPVVITHDGTEHVGYVSDYRPGDDGYYFAKVVIFHPYAEHLLNNGWGFSTQIHVHKIHPQAGYFNGVLYHAEFLLGVFEHLAIVQHPRHNKAQIIKQNSLKEDFMFKKKSPQPQPRFVRVDDHDIHIDDLVTAYRNKLHNDQKYLNLDDSILIDGVHVPITELITIYKNQQDNTLQAEQLDKLDSFLEPNAQHVHEANNLKNAIHNYVHVPNFTSPVKKAKTGSHLYSIPSEK